MLFLHCMSGIVASLFHRNLNWLKVWMAAAGARCWSTMTSVWGVPQQNAGRSTKTIHCCYLLISLNLTYHDYIIRRRLLPGELSFFGEHSLLLVKKINSLQINEQTYFYLGSVTTELIQLILVAICELHVFTVWWVHFLAFAVEHQFFFMFENSNMNIFWHFERKNFLH